MRLFRSILSIALAFLVLLSSTRFMVGIHYCSGKVANVAIFTPADPCEAERSLPVCHRKMMANAHCCEDQQVIHEADDLKAAAAKIQFTTPLVVDFALHEIVISEIVPSAAQAQVSYHHYDPPLRACDLTVQLQVFLI